MDRASDFAASAGAEVNLLFLGGDPRRRKNSIAKYTGAWARAGSNPVGGIEGNTLKAPTLSGTIMTSLARVLNGGWWHNNALYLEERLGLALTATPRRRHTHI